MGLQRIMTPNRELIPSPMLIKNVATQAILPLSLFEMKICDGNKAGWIFNSGNQKKK